MPSENPSEPEIAKLRKDGVNQKQKRSHVPRVEPAGTFRLLARLEGWVSVPFTESGKAGGRIGKERYAWRLKKGLVHFGTF